MIFKIGDKLGFKGQAPDKKIGFVSDIKGKIIYIGRKNGQSYYEVETKDYTRYLVLENELSVLNC